MRNMFSKRFALHLAGLSLLMWPVVGLGQQPRPKTAPPAQQPAANTQKAPAATAPANAAAENKSAAATAANKDGKAWSLKVTKKAPITISLSAKNGNLSEIASEISKRLKVPVLLTPLMQRQKITQEFEGLPLEGALRMLAPQVFVDYELGGDLGGQPKVVGIYLQGMNEPPPAESALVKGDSEAILIEGNTEDGLEASDERADEKLPLRVTVEKNQISVRARKQPLTAVLYEMASKVDIPFEMKYESTELVDVDFNNYTMEQAVLALSSPNIRLYQRTNLTNYEVRPLRLVLVSPANNQQTTKM